MGNASLCYFGIVIPLCIYFQAWKSVLRTQCNYLSSTTCFSRFWPSSAIFRNIRGKAYRGGGFPFTVNTPKYTSSTLFPIKE